MAKGDELPKLTPAQVQTFVSVAPCSSRLRMSESPTDADVLFTASTGHEGYVVAFAMLIFHDTCSTDNRLAQVISVSFHAGCMHELSALVCSQI